MCTLVKLHPLLYVRVRSPPDFFVLPNPECTSDSLTSVILMDLQVMGQRREHGGIDKEEGKIEGLYEICGALLTMW